MLDLNGYKTLIVMVFLLVISTRCALSLDEFTPVNTVSGVKPNHGVSVDLSLVFKDQAGREATLGELFAGNIPIIITPVYFKCPRLCSLVLNGFLEFLNATDLKLGRDFKVLTISINPDEGPELGSQKRDAYLNELKPYQKEGSEGWFFMTGGAAAISSLMSTLGFNYTKDGVDFAHSAAIMILTSGGQISQYFQGIEFPAWDLKLALVEASAGHVGTLLDHAALFCFRFDPLKGKYTLAAYNLVRLGGALSLLGLFGVIFFLWRKERKA